MLPELTDTNSMETVPSFMKRLMAVHRATEGTKDLAGAIIGSDPDTTDYKTRAPPKSVIKLSSRTGNEVERAFADIGVVAKADLDVIVENFLTEWTDTLHLQTIKTVESPIEDVLQASYFAMKNGLKSSLFTVGKEALGEVIRSSRALTLSKDDMQQPSSGKCCRVHECEVTSVQQGIHSSDWRNRRKAGGQSRR